MEIIFFQTCLQSPKPKLFPPLHNSWCKRGAYYLFMHGGEDIDSQVFISSSYACSGNMPLEVWLVPSLLTCTTEGCTCLILDSPLFLGIVRALWSPSADLEPFGHSLLLYIPMRDSNRLILEVQTCFVAPSCMSQASFPLLWWLNQTLKWYPSGHIWISFMPIKIKFDSGELSADLPSA